MHSTRERIRFMAGMKKRGALLVSLAMFASLQAAPVAAGGDGLPGSEPDTIVDGPEDTTVFTEGELDYLIERYEISRDEAQYRLDTQEIVGELLAKLERDARSVFAGMWIENEPEFKVVVRATAQDPVVTNAVSQSGLSEIVELRSADHTFAELHKAHDEIRHQVSTKGPRT